MLHKHIVITLIVTVICSNLWSHSKTLFVCGRYINTIPFCAMLIQMGVDILPSSPYPVLSPNFTSFSITHYSLHTYVLLFLRLLP